MLGFFMLYNRHEIAELIRQQPKDIQPMLLALAWILSRGQTNLIQDGYYGLLQVNLELAKANGYNDNPMQLLDPATNVKIASDLLLKCGLLAFLGRLNASQASNAIELSKFIADAL
jgi:hypothetical protein